MVVAGVSSPAWRAEEAENDGAEGAEPGAL
jgi:hypothetical protein